MGGAFLQRIVRLVFMFIAESEACFGEEGECEDGQLGRGKEDVKGGVVDPFDACGYSMSRCTLADARCTQRRTHPWALRRGPSPRRRPWRWTDAVSAPRRDRRRSVSRRRCGLRRRHRATRARRRRRCGRAAARDGGGGALAAGRGRRGGGRRGTRRRDTLSRRTCGTRGTARGGAGGSRPARGRGGRGRGGESGRRGRGGHRGAAWRRMEAPS